MKFFTEGTLAERSSGRKNNVGTVQLLAALGVMYSHAFPIAQNSNAGELLLHLTGNRLSCGNTAVFIFLMLSGYLIAGSYERAGSFFAYIKKRVLRLLPALLLALLFSTFVIGAIYTTLPLGEYLRSPATWQYLKNILLYPLYWNLPGVFEGNVYSASVNGALWTIPYQFGLYVALGVVGAAGLLKSKKFSVGTFLVLALLYYRSGQLLPESMTHFMLMPIGDWFKLGLYFTAGVCAYNFRDRILLSWRGAALSMILLTLSVSYYQLTEMGLVIFGTYAVLFLCFGMMQIRLPLSHLSYEIYLLGFPIQQAVTASFGGQMHPYLNMLIAIPITLALAFLMERFCERPLLRLLAGKPKAQTIHA